MHKTLTAVYDGQFLRPEAPVDLEPNTRYIITIQGTLPQAGEGDAWDTLEALTGIVKAPSDWASEHDHYLYGTSKTQEKDTP